MPMQSGLQTLTVTTASSPSGDSGVSQSNNAYNATMHRNNRTAFVLRQTESGSTRAITPHRAPNTPFFGAFPGNWQLSCVLRAYIRRQSVIYMMYLHVSEACLSS